MVAVGSVFGMIVAAWVRRKKVPASCGLELAFGSPNSPSVHSSVSYLIRKKLPRSAVKNSLLLHPPILPNHSISIS